MERGPLPAVLTEVLNGPAGVGLTRRPWLAGLALVMLCAGGCGGEKAVPAETMDANELARAIERVAIVKEPPPVKPSPMLTPLNESDVPSGFRERAICSMATPAGLLVLASGTEAVVRLQGKPLLVTARAPVAVDGAYFETGSTRMSIGLARTARSVGDISHGGAEARLTTRHEERFSVTGSWTCKLQRPSN